MSRERRDRVLETLFSVRPAELRLTALLFAQCLCTVGAFIIARSVRDALFMAHRSTEGLAAMYIASALAVTAVGLAYARVADTFRRDTLTAAFACTFAFGFAAFRFLLGGAGEWIYSALYVFVEVVGALTVIQFWTLANDIFTSRDAKRLFGTIGAGGTLANILFGGFVGGAAKQLGSENLLLVCTVLLLLVATVAARVGRRIPVRLGRSKSSNSQRNGASRIVASPHLKSVAALAAITFVACTLVDFQFKVVAAATFQRDELTAYFGRFYAICGALSLAVQFFGTSRLLSRFGVVVALSVLPFFLGVGSVAMFVVPGLLAASLAKGSENVFRYTVNDATTQLLYMPVAANVRGSAKAFIDGAIKPAAIALSGLALIGYRRWVGPEPAPIALASALACIGWGAVLFRLRGQYVDALQSTLRNRRLDLESARHRIADGATAKVLVRALESAEPKEVLNALELLPHLQLAIDKQKVNLDGPVERLLRHASAEVRIAALGHLGRRRSLHLGNPVFRLFDDPAPPVRAAAISAFCAIGRDKAVRSVRSYLKDPEPAVRAAAIEGMIVYGGLDGVLSAAEALKTLITHADPLMREHAARVLGNIGVKNFYQPVLELMADKAVNVRRAAIAAAGQLGAQELVPALVYRLSREETAIDAVEALARYGGGIEPVLARVLDNRLEDVAIRRNVPRVLGRLGTREAIDVLMTHLPDPDEGVRRSIYRALSRALRHKRSRSVDRKLILRAIEFELARAYHALSSSEVLSLAGPPGPLTPRTGPAAAEALLASALLDKVDQCEARIFTLLGILHPDAEIEVIYAGYRDASAQDAQRRKANALELLDNLLDRQLKRKLLPLLDDAPRELKLRAAAEHFELPETDATKCLLALLRDESAWVRACAIHLAGERAEPSLLAEVREGLDHPWEVVRESAVVALEKTLPLGELAVAVSRRARDEATFIRQRVRDILAADAASRQSAG